VNEVKDVFKRYAADNGIALTAQDLDDLVNDIIKNVRYNSLTKTPEFPLTVLSVLDDNAVQIINIADNLKGNQFKPTSLIQSQKDFKSVSKIFWSKKRFKKYNY